MLCIKRAVAGCIAVWPLLSGVIWAQTVEGDILRGQGAFLRGAGWYNLHTAQANRINVEATIRWKEDLRKIQRERAYYDAQKAESKKLTVEQFRQQMALKEQELRTNPSINDVQSGAALNALFYDLTDPDLTSDKWKSVSPVQLPPGASVKELIFAFTPHKVSSQASAALTRGVIALSRLEIKDKWPVLMKKDQLAQERKGYEDAYIRVRDKVLKGDYAVEEILRLDTALDNLKEKTLAEIPPERGYRIQAVKFVDDLRDATRMFDARTVDYAREILLDTKDHDATTVEELVAFMTKYRLAFSNSESSPATRDLYSQIYEKLRQQADLLDVKFIVPPVPGGKDEPAPKNKWVSLFNGKDLSGWQLQPPAGKPGQFFAVENGVIVARSDAGKPPHCFILTDRQYSDFALRLEFALDADTDGGVAIRAMPGEMGPRRVNFVSPVLKLMGTPLGNGLTTGDTFDIRDAKNKRDKDAAMARAPGAWNRLEITVNGQTMSASINGKQVVQLTGSSGKRLPNNQLPGLDRSNGRIGLQQIKGTIRFRNIEVQELSSSK